jgi:hypothetical protein
LSSDALDRLRRSAPSKHVAPRNWTKADIFVYRVGEDTLALKDYSGRPWLVRQTLGRVLVRRECAAYAAAGGLNGLAPFRGQAGPFALALAWIDARELASFPVAEVPAELFDRLEALVRSLHGRGVALGDLHHRDVLVDPTGEVHIVDLATAWTLGAHPGRLRRAVFERLCEQDRIAAARLRARYTGGDERQAMAAVGTRALARYRRARRIKSWLNRMRGRRG